MNVVIDTNVLLSAALRDRLPERVVLFVATSDDWRWLVTSEILSEYLEVLRRPRFALAADILQHWAELIDMRTIRIKSPATQADFARDPKDAIFLSAAIAAPADFLITGDRDLLTAEITTPTRIVTAADFATLHGIASSQD